MTWTAAYEAARAEAIRVIPGIVAARDRNSARDAAVLLDDYHSSCERIGLNGAEAWSILATAAIQWAGELTTALASSSGVTVSELTQSMGRHALSFMNETQGVGGF